MPAPVAPTAPTPAVTPPTAPVAPPVPLAPTPMVQSPGDPTTGLSKPLPATPDITAEQNKSIQQPLSTIDQSKMDALQPKLDAKAKAPVKTDAPIDYNKSQGRESEIQKNVTDITTANPTLLKDRTAYNQAFGYATADQGKKAMLDASFSGNQPVQPTASAMYSAIANKLDIPDEQKTSLSFKIAQNRYTKASSYSTMTASQLSSEMTSSRFIQGSQAYEDVKAMNPKLIQDVENLRIVNGSKQNIFTYTNNPDGSSVKVNNLSNTFKEEYMDNF